MIAKSPKDTKILIVDDEADFRNVLAFSFKRKGYQVMSAPNGEAAFELIQSERVDVVISDIRMPGGDGIELLDRVRSNSLDTPIILLVTGYAEFSTEEAYHKGAEALFCKPFDRNILEETILRLLMPREERWSSNVKQPDAGLDIILKVQGLPQAIEAKVMNLGRGGMFVTLPQTLCPNVNDQMEFKISLTDHNALVEGCGIVRWVRLSSKESQLPAGCGLEFTYLGDAERNRVLEYINANMPKSYIPNQ
jgi:CheY-like chemotaxis protein